MSCQPACRAQAVGSPQLRSCAQAVCDAPLVPYCVRCIPRGLEKSEQCNNNNNKWINSFPYTLSLPVVLLFFLLRWCHQNTQHPAKLSTLSCFMARFTQSPGLDAQLRPVLFQILWVLSTREDTSIYVSFMLQYNHNSYILGEILAPQTSESSLCYFYLSSRPKEFTSLSKSLQFHSLAWPVTNCSPSGTPSLCLSSQYT